MKYIYLKYFLLLMLPVVAYSQTIEDKLITQNWKFRKKGDKQWLSASVPGTVHTDLFSNKIIPDPFFGNNEKQLQWIENEDWEYITSFSISKKELNQSHIELRFDGLDTYSKVYLNDSLILTADNMFRTWNIDVKKFLVKGDNQLYILFESAVKKGKEEAKKLPYTLPGDEKVFTRKAQYQYGWDWGPRFVTCGIWKNVKLIYWNEAKIENVKYIQKSLTDSLAEVEFVCEIKSDSAGSYNLSALQYLISKPSDAVNFRSDKTIILKKGINIISVEHKIVNPRRWWTKGLGETILYPFSIVLSKNENDLDEKSLNIGLRTIELVQQKDSIGSSFYFKLNGVSVFMKGANFIPLDNFLPRVIKSDYEKIIQNAVDVNMNMLRVWGGGVYADDEFYEQCDKKGILVWQDFMFACAMYPSNDNFINNVSAEIVDQVKRLRNHPSIALWCGNNEVDEGWKNWGWQKQYHYSEKDSTKIENDYKFLFEDIIKNTVTMYDPSRAYWPSSPSIGWGHKESLKQGDSHYWGVWWGMEPFENYSKKVGRFMSEYGFQGMPSRTLFSKIGVYKEQGIFLKYPPYDAQHKLADAKTPIDSVILFAHQKHPTGYQTIKTYMERDYKIPTSFENYCYVSQLLQADGMKTAIEAHRRAKPYCMGTLYWQLNDCWPAVSWSSIDYYGKWKASHYQTKRSFENILVSINEEKDRYKVYIVNDELTETHNKLFLRLLDFKGNILWSDVADIIILANSSADYFSIDKKKFAKFNAKATVLSASLIIPKALEITNAIYYFVKPKELELTKPTITVNIISDNKIEVMSNVLAKGVTLNFADVVFDDNYFDLLPNEKKVIFIKNNNILLSDKSMEIKSLFDTIEK